MKGLYEFLANAELQQYFEGFKDKLKVNSIDQIKYVDDEDLAGVGMSKPEIRRLRQVFKKECPQNALDKLRKINPLSSKSDRTSPDKVASTDTSWFGSRSLRKDGGHELSGVHSMSTSSLFRRGTVERSESARLSLRPRRKLNSALIGRPESDIRHVSHIGYDGAVFGDVSQYGDLSDQLPLRPSSARCARSDMTNSCISLPVSDDCTRDLQHSRDGLKSNLSSELSDDDSLSDFQLPDFSIDFGCSLMDEVMQALGMMSNGDSPDCPKDDKKLAVVGTMQDVIDDSDNDSDDTATGGSDREAETPTTPTSPSDFTAMSLVKRPLNANIRAPRGIPGINKGINGVDRILSRDKLPESQSVDSAAETNPLRRLRQNHLMFSH